MAVGAFAINCDICTQLPIRALISVKTGLVGRYIVDLTEGSQYQSAHGVGPMGTHAKKGECKPYLHLSAAATMYSYGVLLSFPGGILSIGEVGVSRDCRMHRSDGVPFQMASAKHPSAWYEKDKACRACMLKQHMWLALNDRYRRPIRSCGILVSSPIF
jgi:hypothetical protein